MKGRGLALVSIALLGCRSRAPTADVIDGGAVPDPVVAEACARCHVAPPPDALTKEVWKVRLPGMAGMPPPPGVTPLAGGELAAAQGYYDHAAPARHPFVPQGAEIDPQLAYEVLPVHVKRPDGTSYGTPAVTALILTSLVAPPLPELFFADLRTLGVWYVPLTRTPRAIFAHAVPEHPVHLEAGDLDGDGRGELLVTGIGRTLAPNDDRHGLVLVLRQPEPGRFVAAPPLARDLARSSDAKLADLDGDGDLDLVVAAFGFRGPGELVLFEAKAGIDAPRFEPRTLDPRDGAVGFQIVDFDRDGRLDVVALIAQEHEELMFYRGLGELRFEAHRLLKAPHPGWGYSGLEVVDLDGDGDLDALLTNGDTLDDYLLKPYHGVEWVENHGERRFERHEIGRLYGAMKAVPADLDQDGDLDVLAAAFLPHLSRPELERFDLDSVVWFERRPEGFRRRVIEKRRPFHITALATDLDGDRRPEVVLGNYVFDGFASDGPIEHLTILRARPPSN